MKRYIKTLIFTLIFFTTVNVLASDSDTIEISGTISAPLTVNNVVNASGWNFVRPTNGKCVYKIPKSGQTTIENNNGNCHVLNSGSNASYEISGESEQNVSISYSKNGFQDSGISVKKFEDSKGANLNNSAQFTLSQTNIIDIAVTLEVLDSVAEGQHDASVDVTVSYQ